MNGACRVSFGSKCHAEMAYEDLPIDLQVAMHRTVSPIFTVKCSDPLAYVANVVGVRHGSIKSVCVKMERRVFIVGAFDMIREETCEKLVSLVIWRVMEAENHRWRMENPEMDAVFKNYPVWMSKEEGIKGWRHFYREDVERVYPYYPSRIFEKWASKCLSDFYRISSKLGPLTKTPPAGGHSFILQLFF